MSRLCAICYFSYVSKVVNIESFKNENALPRKYMTTPTKTIELTAGQSIDTLVQVAKFNGDLDSLFNKLKSIELRGRGVLESFVGAKSGYTEKEDIMGVIKIYHTLVSEQANEIFRLEVTKIPAKIADPATYDYACDRATTAWGEDIRGLTKLSGNPYFPDPQSASPLRELPAAIKDYERIKNETADLRSAPTASTAAPTR